MESFYSEFDSLRIGAPISPDQEPNKKKYNALEPALQAIQKAIALCPDERTQHNTVVHGVLDIITKELKAVDKLFNNIYLKTLYGGSYYDKLKLNCPDEYDIDLALRLPKETSPVLKVSDISGFVQIHVDLEALKKKPNYEEFRAIEKLVDGHNYLLTEKFRDWFEGVLNKAKNNLDRKRSKYTFNVSKSGPAFTLKLNIDHKLVSVDLVPSLIFTDDKWPGSPFRKNETTNHEFLVVPKTPSNSSRYNISWRLSFQEQEKLIINGKCGLKDTIRLLKLLRNHQIQESSFPSYYLKTVMMWMNESVDENYWKNPRSYIFMMGLKYFCKLLENRRLPYYWNKDYNFLKEKKEITLENWSRRMDRIFKTLETSSSKSDVLKLFDLGPFQDFWSEYVPFHEEFNTSVAENIEEVKPSTSVCSKPKKRARNPSRRKRNMSKRKKCAGLQYETEYNKTTNAKKNALKEFLENFPSHESHYAREKINHRRCLPPDLSLDKMYELYSKEAKDPLSYLIFLKTFNKVYNMHFNPSIYSCKECNLFSVQIAAADEARKDQLESEKEMHQRKAQIATDGLRYDTELAIKGGISVICFDLMKTLPTPLLTTGISYHKRPLWTNCFSIHDMGTANTFMFVWDETIASRGSQEVGSCILFYIKHFVKSTKLIMYSHQCEGQNRNIKLSLLCNYITASPLFSVEEIDHKFLVSGHSYLPCDQYFGLIKKAKQFHPHIYIPEDWQKVITDAREKNPFKVIELKKSDFISTKLLKANITNRKFSTTNVKIEWRKIQWLRFRKDSPYTFQFKYSNDADVDFTIVDIGKRNSTSKQMLKLPVLYPDGNIISAAKKRDLLQLMEFIPPVHHEFYENIRSSPMAA